VRPHAVAKASFRRSGTAVRTDVDAAFTLFQRNAA
jgi:hypothetical protein